MVETGHERAFVTGGNQPVSVYLQLLACAVSRRFRILVGSTLQDTKNLLPQRLQHGQFSQCAKVAAKEILMGEF